MVTMIILDRPKASSSPLLLPNFLFLAIRNGEGPQGQKREGLLGWIAGGPLVLEQCVTVTCSRRMSGNPPGTAREGALEEKGSGRRFPEHLLGAKHCPEDRTATSSVESGRKDHFLIQSLKGDQVSNV